MLIVGFCSLARLFVYLSIFLKKEKGAEYGCGKLCLMQAPLSILNSGNRAAAGVRCLNNGSLSHSLHHPRAKGKAQRSCGCFPDSQSTTPQKADRCRSKCSVNTPLNPEIGCVLLFSRSHASRVSQAGESFVLKCVKCVAAGVNSRSVSQMPSAVPFSNDSVRPDLQSRRSR